MKFILLVSLLVFCGFAGVTQAEQEDSGPLESDIKLSELALLPQGLNVVHSPDSVLETFFGPSGFQWTHSTTVSSTVGPVTLLEFGYFIERNGQWELSWASRAPYSASDFAEWYDCPDAELQPGESYTNPYNQSVKDCSPEQVARWYFIGLDSKGSRVKGEADVRLISELAEFAK